MNKDIENGRKTVVQSFFESPLFFTVGSLFAIASWLKGWIAFEYTLICVGAAVAGIVLHFKKKGKRDADGPD